MELKVNEQTASAKNLNEFSDMLISLTEGTKKMRHYGELFLPKWPSETDEAYKLRKDSATLFPVYSRTVEVLGSRPFSEPVAIDKGAPKNFVDIWAKNIDNEGSSLDQFANRLLVEVLGKGFAGLLVDSPPKGAEVISQADEKAAGIRPYFCVLRADSILGWRAELVNGEHRFTQLRFTEEVTEPDTEFGENVVTQVRVLEPKRWRIFRKDVSTGGKGEWLLYKEGTTDWDYVPFVPVYGKYHGFMTCKPPLLNLAYMNVEHWQSKSDQQTILHVARVPILTMIGGDEKSKIVVGGSSAVNVPSGGDLKFTEHSGKAIEAGQKSLDSLELQMRQAGAELLVMHDGKVTATQVWSENEAGMSTLQRMVINLEVSINFALKFMCQMAGENEVATINIFKDFSVQSLSDASAEMILKLNLSGRISDETAFAEFQRRGILEGGLNYEDEKAKLLEQGPNLGVDGLPAPNVNINESIRA
jgi:hypothetical protein